MAPRIVIVGAGPAGSTTALALLAHGVDPDDVLLLDRRSFPRPKLCGGAVTARGVQWLEQLTGRELPAFGHRTASLLFEDGTRSLRIREVRDQALFDRGELDHWLLQQACAAGVAFRPETVVTDLQPQHDQWRLDTTTGVVSGRWVVGADGAAGVVGRSVPERVALGRLVEGVYEADPATDPSQLRFDFSPVHQGIGGYGWIFPYPAPDGGIKWKLGIMDGCGREPGADLRQWVTQFSDEHGFRLQGRLDGWPERYFDPGRRVHRPGLILVGEAWGIDPLLGEGIAPALAMAKYAAGRLTEALADGRRVIGSYELRFLLTEEGWNLGFHRFLADRLYGPDGPWWLAALFDSRRLQRLAASGRASYGRLARHGPTLLTAWLGARMRSAFGH